jgi:outer membrane protein assembly factor BamB
MHSFANLAGILSLAALTLPPAAADDWSRFRGPNGSGVSDSTGLPAALGPDENVEWVTEVPFGRSSPAVARDRIFLTAVEGDKLVTISLARATGKLLWRAELERREVELYKDTDSATPTPATDGSGVYAFFHEFGLVAYDGNGGERWRLPLGPFRNFYGIAASPVLAGKAVIVVCDQAEGSFVMAVNRKNGKVLWRRNRPARLESYTTPILHPGEEKPRAVVVSGSRWVDAYDLASGSDVWTVAKVGTGPVSSPVLSGDTLFVVAPDQAEQGWPEFGGLLEEHDRDGDGSLSRSDVDGVWIGNHFGWLDADRSGEITAADWEYLGSQMVNDNWGVYAIRVPQGEAEPQILWNYRKNIPYLPTPLLYDGVFYMVRDGIVTSLDPRTGDLLKRDRIGDDSVHVYASPVAADGKIYIATMDGKVAVLAAGPRWTVLETNELGEEIWATPAVADGHLYVRTRGKLYSFASSRATPAGAAESASRGR